MTDLTQATSERRTLWLEIAQEALRRWTIPTQKICWLGQGSNLLFKVRTADADYALRLQPAKSGGAARLRSELRWLSLIRRETALLAPMPVEPLVDGRAQPILELSHDLLPPSSGFYAALFEYIDGEVKPARDLSTCDVYRIGEYLATLHSAAQFDATAGFDRPRLDWEGLFAGDSPYAAPKYSLRLRAEQRAILDEVAAQLRSPMSALASRADASGWIHADLLAKNIVFQADSIAALDFEFCGWGFYLYDLAPLLWQLKGERAADYQALEDALWSGYTAIKKVADSDRGLLESLIAARQAASIRWLLSNLDNPKLRALAPPLIAERCAELEAFLQAGSLRRRSATL